jgi:metallo-beta-lactamase class B
MKIKSSVLLILIFSASLMAQQSADDRRANTPIEPFQIIGNIYYVGAAEVTSFLITSPKGHILIDGGYAETVPQIKANVIKLGFNLHDIKYLLNTQAHFDHAGGLDELKKLTGAKMLASAADKVLLENGGKGDFAFGDTLPYTPVMVDRVIKDGETIKLGSTRLKTILMPGHTKGSTAWSMKIIDAGKKLNVLFFSSATSPGYKFYGNPDFPDIIAVYEKTFTRLKTLTPDIFLASHGSFFSLLEKAERRGKDKTNPFIEQETYKTYLADTEKDFREKLVKQRQENPVK